MRRGLEFITRYILKGLDKGALGAAVLLKITYLLDYAQALPFLSGPIFDSQVYLAQAAAVISLASWAMIVSGVLGGRIADRSGRGAQMFYLCAAVGIGALLLLREPGWAVVLSLVFGLAGGAPAGVTMALTGEAMAPQRRAFGMGVFFSLYFVLLSLAPPLAGWLYDARDDAFVPICFAVVLLVGAALCFGLFGVLKRRLPPGEVTPSAPPPAP